MFRYLKFRNLLKNWGKYVFHWAKCNFEHSGDTVDICGYRNIFSIR